MVTPLKFLFVLMMSATAYAESGTGSLSTVDIHSRLQDALHEAAEENLKEQKLTGGTMLVGGGALAAAGIFGAIVGNDYSTQNAPVYYITAGGLLTVGGIMNLTRDNTFYERVKALELRPSTTLADIQARVEEERSLLMDEKDRAKRMRIWGGVMTFLLGASNATIAAVTTPPSRLGLEVVGYSGSAIGFLDFVVERRRMSGAAMMGLGISNATLDRIDPYAPSSDYLYVSGGIIAAVGVARLLIPTSVEKQTAVFYDTIKSETPSVELFLTPTPYGWMASSQIIF